eukprot:268817-Hanusia_phi.AAC.1
MSESEPRMLMDMLRKAKREGESRRRGELVEQARRARLESRNEAEPKSAESDENEVIVAEEMEEENVLGEEKKVR